MLHGGRLCRSVCSTLPLMRGRYLSLARELGMLMLLYILVQNGEALTMCRCRLC